MSNTNYRFPIEEKAGWLSHLHENGCVVLGSALSPEDVQVSTNLLYRDLRSGHSIDFDDIANMPKTKWNFIPHHGIVASLAQTAGPWHVRGNANIHKAFSYIWKTSDLITSMDAVILCPGSRKPITEGLHLDQNPFNKPNLDCIQGMVPLLPVTPEIGGLEVVPFSHTVHAKEQQCQENPHWSGDFCMIHDENQYKDSRLLLECNPGDLILWDSRTIHGGRVGTGSYDTHGLVRMSVTVAMTPRDWASPQVQELRQRGFEHGESFNHCPHEVGTSSGTFHAKRKKGYHIFQLTESERAIL